MTQSWIPEFEAFGERVLKDADVPGVHVGLAQDGEIIYEHAFGYRDVEKGLKSTIDTVWGLGSISKSFTALSILHLQDAGKLSVQEPVIKYLPDFPVPHPKYREIIKVHDLLTHSSGMPNEWAIFHARAPSMRRDPDIRDITSMRLPYDFFTPESEAKDISTPQDLIGAMAASDFQMLGPPGRYYNYSNEGYGMLQAIVERLSGMTGPEYLRKNIYGPLGLTHTDTQVETLARFPDEMTTLYARFKDGVRASPAWQDISMIIGNGGLASNIRDLIRYAELYRNYGTVNGNQVLSKDAVEQMSTPHMPTLGPSFYGYGLQVLPDYNGYKLIGHGGGNKGVSAYMGIVRERGLTVAGAANLTGAPTQRVTRALLNAELGLPLDTPEPEFKEYPIPAEKLLDFTGIYRRSRREIRYEIKDGDLHQETEERSVALRPCAEDCFRVGSSQQSIQFLRNEDGAIWAFYSAADNRLIPKAE